jgi:DNA repair protein RadA/Sms
MAKVRTIYRCTECGAATPQWNGKCASCLSWNTLVEEIEESRALASSVSTLGAADRPVAITTVSTLESQPRATGVSELDRVLGGGLVPGSVTLVGGEPGVGKSTLLLQVLANQANRFGPVLYVSGEESKQQVRSRAERLDALSPSLFLQSEARLPYILSAIQEVRPSLLVVDSIQTVEDPDIGSAPGSVVQVRECAHRLVRETKSGTMATVLVGHVTKEGGLAGPRVLEHVVDTVLSFEGDRHHALRMLRATKHRFGSTNELGLFEMREEGLISVPDPSGLFLADRRVGVVGSAVVPILEGQRPLLVEVQALVASTTLTMPRRSVQGMDNARLAMLLAVLEKRANIDLSKSDVYVSAVGGVRLTEPGSDLGICMALASAVFDVPVGEHITACGEVGLGGELRQVSQTPRRLAEAARLGFRQAIVPSSAPKDAANIQVLRADTLTEALRIAGLNKRRDTARANTNAENANGS